MEVIAVATLQARKGQTRALPPGSTLFTGGLGWDAKGGDSVDLDLWVLRHHQDGSIVAIYWGNVDLHDKDPKHRNSEGNPWIVTPEGDVVHKGDDRTGAESASGYDETVVIDTTKTPADVVKYSLFATIYDENNAGLTLGMAENIVCGFRDEATGHEVQAQMEAVHGFDVTVLCATLERSPTGWTLTNVDQGYSDGMVSVARKLGLVFAG